MDGFANSRAGQSSRLLDFTVSLLRWGCRKNPDRLDVVRSDPYKIARHSNGSASSRWTKPFNNTIYVRTDHGKQHLSGTHPYGSCSSRDVAARSFHSAVIVATTVFDDG